jgi:hypothetical protein
LSHSSQLAVHGSKRKSKKKKMKAKILRLITILLLLLPVCMVLLGAGCEKEETRPEFIGPIEGYITGTFICYEKNNETHATTDNPTPRGFCILIEGSKNKNSNYPMDFYTFNFPEGLIDFQEGLISSSEFDRGHDCGPSFFADSLLNKYKISFKYRDVNESESIKFSCGFCPAIYVYFPWEDYSQKILDELKQVK